MSAWAASRLRDRRIDQSPGDERRGDRFRRKRRQFDVLGRREHRRAPAPTGRRFRGASAETWSAYIGRSRFSCASSQASRTTSGKLLDGIGEHGFERHGVERAVGDAVAADERIDERDLGRGGEDVFFGRAGDLQQQSRTAGFPLFQQRPAAERQFVDQRARIVGDGRAIGIDETRPSNRRSPRPGARSTPPAASGCRRAWRAPVRRAGGCRRRRGPRAP